MERLTKKIDGGYMLKIPKDNNISDLEIKYNVYDKLGRYEDLFEQGKIIELPCKIGDTVYIISRQKIVPVKIHSISITEHEISMSAKNEECFGYGGITLNEKKTPIEWYTTESEAEQVFVNSVSNYMQTRGR